MLHKLSMYTRIPNTLPVLPTKPVLNKGAELRIMAKKINGTIVYKAF